MNKDRMVKPDGWCAWHLDHGYLFATEDGGILVASEPEMLKMTDESPYSKRLRKDGWRVRPVKLIFLDEDAAVFCKHTWPGKRIGMSCKECDEANK